MSMNKNVSLEEEMRRTLASHISQEVTEYLDLHIGGKAGPHLSIWRQVELLQCPVCIEGEAGSGKTSLAWHICCLWGQGQILRNMMAVIIVDIQACLNASSLEDVLQPYSKKLRLPESTNTWLESLIQHNREKVFVIFDGVEKLSQGDNDKRFAYQFLIESVQMRAPVLLLGRPGTMDLLSQFHIRVESHFEVLGFENTEVMERYVSQHVTRPVFRSVKDYMREQPWMMHLCKNPRMASILVESLGKDRFFLRETKTAVLHHLLLRFIATECPNCSSAPSLYQLPTDTDYILRHICYIALVCTLMGNDLQEQELSHINLNKGVSSLRELGNLGLVYRVGNRIQFLAESSASCVVKFFLCAFNVSLLSLSDQVHFYCDNSSSLLSSLSLVSVFHFGLGRLNHQGWFDSGKLALGSAVDCLAQGVEMEKNSSEKRKKNLVLLGCIRESRETSLVRSFIGQFPELIKIELPIKISMDEQHALAFMITHSGIKEWQIESSNKEFVDHLAFYFATSLSEEIKIQVLIVDKESAVVLVKPVSEPKPPAKKSGSALAFVKRGTTEYEKEELFKHAVQCNAQREALHRVFNLYSKVKLRSDAGDPAYLSFITCQCVEEKLHGEVVLGPIHPVHSVKLAAKNKKAKRIEAEREAARKHIEEEHNQNYTEIIVLTRPYPKSLTFQPQGSSETCQLVLSTDKIPSCMAGRIAMEVRESILSDRYVNCIAESETQRVKKLEMVTHGLPLPKSKSKSEAEKANATPGGQKADGRRSGDGPPATADIPATAAQVAPSHPYKNLHDEPVFSPAPAQAESSEKITWRPGMIMFTTMPEVFTKERTYSLPPEDHLIRKGGNGQIFSFNYSGYDLVAKKTHFRNREYNIIIRLKHSNILPLLAVMVGEASHRRRFYCYHILPRMSGDVARMLSDHQSLTLVALRERNSDNPRQFGLALGNLRFLLAEVLRGLAYLHSLHIVHRDIKASNILVRFHCQHDNLLWCTCKQKYTVCICDFDAAVELNERNELLPISQTMQVFYLPPVGTTGFRSPEGSQLIIATHFDAIIPHMSPKADVYSFGILMLRLFLGEDGPSSQRENSMLLLSYHQMHHMKEGRGMPEVSRQAVQKILKIPILESKLAGIPHIIDFVSRCLQVSPDERPSASDLLKHKFLF